MKKLIYHFGRGSAEGNANMKNILGGKGANLAEMANLGLPIPPGFTIATDICNHYYEENNNLSEMVELELGKAVKALEKRDW
jgi:pyruvate, orthophosphate dikinase